MAESFEATGTPESLEDKLTADIVDGDDDNALLDTVLGDVSTNDDQDRELNILDQDEGGGETGRRPGNRSYQARVKEMEEEAEKLKEMQGEVDKQIMSNKTNFPTIEEKMEMDTRSVYVGNVDYHATAEELGQHFHGCGAINRVTILCDKYTGHPKGYAYVEFTDKDSIPNAQALDESLFKGRQIKVVAKRTNKPGLSTTNRGAMRGVRRGRGGFRGANPGGFFPYMAAIPMPYFYRGGSRGRTFRGRARSNWYAPY
eukprot:Em0018g1020a